MAIETFSDEQLAEQLLGQAQKLDERAEQLRAGARDLAEEAGRLRAEAHSLQREPLRMLPGHFHASRDERLLRQIMRCFEQMGPLSTAQLAEHLAFTPHRIRVGVARLVADGKVKKGGVGSATIWGLADDDSLASVHPHSTAQTVIRDAARELGEFTFKEISKATPTVSDQSLRMWLPRFEEEGVLESVKEGTTKLWAYAPPEGESPARPRHETPEKIAMRMAGPAPRRGSVEGIGGRQRSGTPIVDKLIREARRHGVTIRKTKHQIQYVLDGEVVATSSKTPGASSLKETRSDLRKAGVPV